MTKKTEVRMGYKLKVSNPEKATFLVKEQYRKILQFLTRVEAKEPVDLKEMLKNYLHLFVLIRDSLDHGDEWQKNESMWILGEFFILVNEESKKLRLKTGMSNEEIFRVGENPNFFSKEQWAVIEQTRHKMKTTGIQVADLIQKRCDEVY